MLSEKRRKLRKITKQIAVKAMGGRCQCCGYKKCLRALQFHHICPGSKNRDFQISEWAAKASNWHKIVSELEKCILVCSNCHAEIHAGELDLPAKYKKFNNRYRDFKKIKLL